MAKEPVQSVTIQGTAAHFRGIMQRLKILWDGSWTSSTGEVLKFQEERVTQRLGNSLDLDFPRRVDKTSPDRTSWLITSLKPVTEDERQSKIPAIRETFAHGPDDHPENHIQPWKTAGVEAWDLPGGRTQVDFIDAYSPYRQQVAGEALWLPIGPAFVEFSTAVLETPGIVRSEVPKWLTKQAPEEAQTRVPEVVRAIEEWTPKQRFKGEEAYEAALAEYLVAQGIDAPEQQGMSLTDVLAAHGIGIEIKLTPDRSDYDRLAGQIMRQLEEYGVVVVLILRPDKRDLLDEYKSRFDDRVVFITKGRSHSRRR